MFTATIMARIAYVTLPIASLVCVEVVKRLLSAARKRSSITVMRIVAVVDVAVKAVRTMKPGTSPDKHSSSKPIGPIVTVGGTVIGSVVEVPIGAHRGHSNVDGNLGWRYRCRVQEGDRESREGKKLTVGHNLSSIRLEIQREGRVVRPAQKCNQ
jgi:hypothetical protein